MLDLPTLRVKAGGRSIIVKPGETVTVNFGFADGTRPVTIPYTKLLEVADRDYDGSLVQVERA